MISPKIQIDGAVVAITVGARGIGKATAELFAASGATVSNNDLDPTTAGEARAATSPPPMLVAPVRITDRSSTHPPAGLVLKTGLHCGAT